MSTNCQVAGGTAWLWARQDAFQSLDTLFIDEAAQMSLANVLADFPNGLSHLTALTLCRLLSDRLWIDPFLPQLVQQCLAHPFGWRCQLFLTRVRFSPRATISGPQRNMSLSANKRRRSSTKGLRWATPLAKAHWSM
jgi:hypothetical protein